MTVHEHAEVAVGRGRARVLDKRVAAGVVEHQRKRQRVGRALSRRPQPQQEGVHGVGARRVHGAPHGLRVGQRVGRRAQQALHGGEDAALRRRGDLKVQLGQTHRRAVGLDQLAVQVLRAESRRAAKGR